MAEPKRPVTDVRLEVGSEFSATVLMAAGFVLANGVELRERYRIESTLGRGGMGQVFAVSIEGGPEAQRYALKVVARPEDHNRDGIIDDQERAAAQEQLDVFARLLRKEAIKQEVVQRHGVSVARMVALVRLDDGSLGMRMELAHGVALEELLEDESANRGRTPDVRFAVTVARKLLGQLRRLHELTEAGMPQGFIHSDIKPANIFVDARDRVDPHVTLLDFGVAIAGQLMAQDLASTVGKRTTFLLEQSGGTVGYAPPHHFTSKPTPLSDVFATIVILYELVAVDWPWDAAGMRKNAINLFRLESLMAQPPRPVREVRASVLPSDAAVLDKFFCDAFARLVTLAERVADALGSGDRAQVDALVPALRSLAGEFQSKLDKVAAALAGEVREGPLDTAPALPSSPSGPVVASAMGPNEREPDAATVAGVVGRSESVQAASGAGRRPSGWAVVAALVLAGAAGLAVGALRPWQSEERSSGIGAFSAGPPGVDGASRAVEPDARASAVPDSPSPAITIATPEPPAVPAELDASSAPEDASNALNSVSEAPDSSSESMAAFDDADLQDDNVDASATSSLARDAAVTTSLARDAAVPDAQQAPARRPPVQTQRGARVIDRRTPATRTGRGHTPTTRQRGGARSNDRRTRRR